MPKRPTEAIAEARADCPHAEFRARYGWPTCRVCGSGAGSVGMGCTYGRDGVGGAGDPGRSGLDRVQLEGQRGTAVSQTLRPGAVA